jgi:hypothetical protein
MTWASLSFANPGIADPGAAASPRPPKSLVRQVDRDDPRAMRVLGQFYLDRAPDPEALKKAAFWFDRAARMDDHAAQAQVSLMYERGQGVAPNPERAAWFAGHATRSGLAADQHRYARLLEAGIGLPANLDEAQRWHRLAADQGHAISAAWLGTRLAQAAATREQTGEAIRYLAVAARGGDESSARSLEQLRAQFEAVSTRPNVNIRRAPSLKAEVLARTTPVTQVYVLGERAEGWLEVYRPQGHVIGYASSRALMGG